MTAPAAITVVEVGPRDGLQNEAATVSTPAKLAWIDALAAAGAPVIEVTAFVSPTWVPQMADAAEVVAGLSRRAGTRYIALVPNAKGLARAQAAGVDGVSVVAAASDAFSLENLNVGMEGGIDRACALIGEATRGGLPARAYLSTAFGCPYEGDVPIERVVRLTARLLEAGATEVAVSDTIGIATPGAVRRLLDTLVRTVVPASVALHFHDTWGMAAANVLAALDYRILTFDASAGGLGGCPYAPGATGNLATEDLLYLLHSLGHPTGIDLDAVYTASHAIGAHVGHVLPSRYVRARSARDTRTRG